MPNAQALRLREALQEFVAAYNGDTGTGRRGGSRKQIPDADKQLVKSATDLLALVDGGPQGDAGQRDTPGARARDRASTGGAAAATAGWGRDAARALVGVAPAAAPDPNNGGT